MTERTPEAAATHDGGVTVYWRPGCPFCSMLERSLKKAKIDYSRKNIWEDPDAAAFVRSVAGGNETVPTVAVGSAFAVNPSKREVLAMMADQTPELLP